MKEYLCQVIPDREIKNFITQVFFIMSQSEVEQGQEKTSYNFKALRDIL